MAADGKKSDTVKGKKSAKPKKSMTPEAELRKIKSGSIIMLFDKTPIPEQQTDVYCPHFWELKYANGCRFDCQWCYLIGTFGRWAKEGDPRTPRLKDIRTIEKDLAEALARLNTPQLFNAGEVSDAMLYPHALLNHIIPLFKDTDKFVDTGSPADSGKLPTKRETKGKNSTGHKLLLLTKDVKNAIKVMSNANATSQIIFAWSVNAHYVSRSYELLTPDSIERLGAARRAIDAGYEVRLRIDPMVPVSNWKIGYRKLIDDIMRICPWATVITLGSLRGLQSTINEARRHEKDMSWLEYLGENSSWGKKIDEDTRYEMYKFAIEELQKRGFRGHIALCKETLSMWKRLREAEIINYGPGDNMCNCTLREPNGPWVEPVPEESQ